MSYILAGTTIKRPHDMDVSNNTQTAQNRALNGTVGRDHFGNNKRVWVLQYPIITPTDFAIIDAIYQSYLNADAAQTWQITETNYTVAQTLVHVDIASRGFSKRGSTYLSDFTLVLTEA